MAKHTTTGKRMPSAVTPKTSGKTVKTGKQMTYHPPKK